MELVNRPLNGQERLQGYRQRVLCAGRCRQGNGRAVYAADVQMTGLLHGFVLRSPHAHARIRYLDTSKAEALPGVRAVVTADDLPVAEDKIEDLGEGAINLKYLSDNVLAQEKALYHGHAVAGVAAVNPHIAREAAELIEVDYEVLPPVMTVDDALAEDAPILLDTLRTDQMGEIGTEPTNLASVFSHQRGDLDAGFAGAHLVVDRTFRTETVHQGYIEPHAATALHSADGQITIWTSTQGSFAVRGQVCEILKIPVSALKRRLKSAALRRKITLVERSLCLSKKAGMNLKLYERRATFWLQPGPPPAQISASNRRDADGKISPPPRTSNY